MIKFSEAEKKDICQRMADLILYHIADKGECDESDLRAAGFPEDQIETFGKPALTEAAAAYNKGGAS